MMKDITLPSGKAAQIREFKGRDILAAQKVSGGETERMIFALIAQCVTIEGRSVVMEDLEDMAGQDCLVLMGEFGSNFTSAPNS